MPDVAENCKDNHRFAASRLIDILPEDKVAEGVVYEITNLESIVLINEGGKLVRKVLPIQAQVTPVKSSIVMDFNNDGNKDILMVGNHYGVEVETTRYDAGIGNLLLGDGNNNFTGLSPLESGFYIPFDSRDVKVIKQTNRNLLVITNNNGAVSFFSFNN
jgi:hypothetical protein